MLELFTVIWEVLFYEVTLQNKWKHVGNSQNMFIKQLNVIAKGNVIAEQKQCGGGLPGKYTDVQCNCEEVICWCISSAFPRNRYASLDFNFF